MDLPAARARPGLDELVERPDGALARFRDAFEQPDVA